MKKEDFTTRLLRNLFHIQGPFDECRQEIIYKSLCPFHGPNRLFFLLSLLVLSVIWTLHRDRSLCHALCLLWTHFFHYLKKLKEPSKNSTWKKMTSQKSSLKPTARRQIKFRSWVVFIGLQIGLFTLLIFHKVFVQQMSLPDFVKLLMQF